MILLGALVVQPYTVDYPSDASEVGCSSTVASGLTSFVDPECFCFCGRVNTLCMVYLGN